MARRRFFSADTLGLVLLWAPVVATLAGALFGWSPMTLVSAAGLAAAVAMWVLVRRVVLRQAERAAELEEAAAEFWSALGQQDPTPAVDDDSVLRAARSLRRARAVMRTRLGSLSRQSADLRAILDAAPSPVLATSRAGEVVEANRAAEGFFTRPRSQLVGQSLEDLFAQAEILGLHAAAAAGAHRSAQVRMPRPDGTRIFQVVSTPAPLAPPSADGAPAETGVVITLRDVTDLA